MSRGAVSARDRSGMHTDQPSTTTASASDLGSAPLYISGPQTGLRSRSFLAAVVSQQNTFVRLLKVSCPRKGTETFWWVRVRLLSSVGELVEERSGAVDTFRHLVDGS